MIAQSFSSGSCPIAQEGPATFIHDCFSSNSGLSLQETRMRSNATLSGEGKGCSDRSNERINSDLATKEYISNDASALTPVAVMVTKDVDYLSIRVFDTHL